MPEERRGTPSAARRGPGAPLSVELLAVLVVAALLVTACGNERPVTLLADLDRWDAASSSGRRAAADAVAAAEPDFAFVRRETFS